MRLNLFEENLSALQKFQLKLINKIVGHIPGPIAVQSYRPEWFGEPFNECVIEALRGTKAWTKAEAELFAAFVSRNNECPYCMSAHTAITSKGIKKDVVTAVLNDWKTAPVNDQIRATLGFLEKLTRTPADVTQADLDPLYAASVSQEAIKEAIYICFIFSLINRLANAFDFEMAPEDGASRLGFILYNAGYGLATLPG